jgi:hypothetical protein
MPRSSTPEPALVDSCAASRRVRTFADGYSCVGDSLLAARVKLTAYCAARLSPSAAAFATGSTTTKRAPTSARFSAQTRPP